MSDAPARLGALMAALALAAGCLPRGDFHCSAAAQCGSNAFCEIDGRCSAGDEICPTGRRYLDNEGDQSNACVGPPCAGNVLVTLVAGGEHACALRHDKTISCWGRNDDGQLGDATRTPRATAASVGGISGATAVAAGARHTCAVVGGAVMCWGADDGGQLGDGNVVSRATPVAVPGLTNAVAVAAGATFSCAVLADGTAECWGDNSQGQLGDGGAATLGRAPTPVFALTGIRAIAASVHGQHACALRDDETLWCWGANASGQLGDGSMTNRPQPVQVQALSEVTAVAVGLLHTCAATRAEGLFCWGDNGNGQLGHEGAVPEPSPVLVPIVTDPVAVAAGDGHTCALRQNGTTLCWGANGDGQLGEGSTSGLPIPTQVTGLVRASEAIVAGAFFSCAQDGFGAAFCWGDDHYGELGTGREIVRALAAPVASVAGAVDLATGGEQSCVATSTKDATGAPTRHAACWGANEAGQLGDGMTTDRTRAAPVAGDVEAIAVAAGLAHSCAIAADGALWCWGRGSSLQLGPGHTTDTPTPTPIALSGGVSGVATGDMHTCAALMDGTAWCWGENADGQLGDGTTTDRAAPAPVSPPADGTMLGAIDTVAAGGAHTCALSSGDILCWGRGVDGQLGDGVGAERALPVRVGLGTGAAAPKASALATGEAHSCALASDGGVWCWGGNGSGQLGTGDTTVADFPTALPGLTGALGVAAGAAHTCAITSARTVSCWGANDDGQLGTGDTSPTPTLTPTPVRGLTDVERLGAGGAHTCALRRDGSVWCWGANNAGQLGEEDALWETTPRLARLACH